MTEQNTITLFCQNCQSTHTASNARYRLLAFARWLETECQVTDLEAVTVSHILAYKQHLAKSNLAPASQARALETLRSFFRWSHQEGMIDHDPARSVKSPRAVLNREPEYLTTEESRKLLDAIDSNGKHAARDLAMAWALAMGLRVGEVVSLNVGDVIPPAAGQLAGLRIHGKRNYERIVPLSQAVYAAIAGYLSLRADRPGAGDPLKGDTYPLKGDDAPLFVCRYAGDDCRRMSTRAVQKWFADLVTSANLARSKGHPHAARHGFATRLLFEGNTPGGVYTVSKLLGHGSLATTEKYLHLDRRAMQTAILADPLAA